MIHFWLKYPLSKICLSVLDKYSQCNLSLWCQKLANFSRSVSLIDGSHSRSGSSMLLAGLVYVRWIELTSLILFFV